MNTVCINSFEMCLNYYHHQHYFTDCPYVWDHSALPNGIPIGL